MGLTPDGARGVARPDPPATNAEQTALFVLLARFRRRVQRTHPWHEFYMVGYPKRGGGRVLRMLCPEAGGPGGVNDDGDPMEMLGPIRAATQAGYPDFDFYMVGYARRPGDRTLRLLCPDLYAIPDTPPPGRPEAGSHTDSILTVLDEADRPLTVVELSHRAIGREPTSALREALHKLVAAGRVREIDGRPKTYERAG